MMMSLNKNSGSAWDCSVNPQPTINGLLASINEQRNLRSLHLSGHTREECAFVWNTDELTDGNRKLDVDEIARVIGAVAGRRGPIECVTLIACATENMGLKFREKGVPHVVCWKTPVHDDTACLQITCLLGGVRQMKSTTSAMQIHRQMRVMYRVVGGRFPFGFMSELQVSLAQTQRAQRRRFTLHPSIGLPGRSCRLLTNVQAPSSESGLLYHEAPLV